jgi:hypothetical protein
MSSADSAVASPPHASVGPLDPPVECYKQSGTHGADKDSAVKRATATGQVGATRPDISSLMNGNKWVFVSQTATTVVATTHTAANVPAAALMIILIHPILKSIQLARLMFSVECRTGAAEWLERHHADLSVW